MLASRGMCAPGSILLQQLLYTHKAATQGRYTISCLYDAFMIRLSPQRPWKERFLLGETRAEKNRPSLLTSREHRWRLFTTLQKSPFSFPFSTQSYWLFFTLSWSNISLLWGGHKVTNVRQAIRTPCWAELFRLEGKHHAFLDNLHTVLTLPSFPHLSQHTLGMVLACCPSTCLWTCVAKASASGRENQQRASRRRDAGEASAAFHCL